MMKLCILYSPEKKEENLLDIFDPTQLSALYTLSTLWLFQFSSSSLYMPVSISLLEKLFIHTVMRSP